MTAPQRLVEDGVRRYGRFDGRVRHTNPVDAHRGLSRLWRAFRLKEWVGFALIHPEISGAMIMQDVKYLASSELFIRDQATGVLVEKSARFRGGTLDLPDDLLDGGRCRVQTRRYLLEYDFAADTGAITVRFDCAADRRGPAITGALTLHVEGAAPPLSLSAKLTSAIDYYTFKQPFPVDGTLTVGDRTYVFERARDFAILDEHRSQFPYSTSWTWGTFAVALAGGVVGSNFVDRPEFSDDDDESSNWVPGAVEPLTGVRFDFDSEDPLSTVHVRDRDGRLDVTFTPAGRKVVKVNLVAAAIDYWQLAGTYRGAVTSLSGEIYSIDSVPGILERMKTRF
ncbi:DUF2804 family protein [Mycolicibacter virginiensis]|uniref:DUF2804 family protein n=1 Tax=Mycolicibacter virginiensis TaxID=1795032 RepID=UPI001F04A3EF|nr:DUF2804 family protein [Mycolicibacter virginiensis]ULP49135.1 DUF2804 domain-containing protein [Mycolicibacter virginiensis]